MDGEGGNKLAGDYEWIRMNTTFPASSTAPLPIPTNHSELAELISSSLLLGPSAGAAPMDSVTAEEVYRDPLTILVTITILYSVIFILGLVGNIITCIVISRNKSMHTAINYYLFNLAITDMLVLLSAMPIDLYNAWYPSQYPFGTAVCVLQGVLAETSTNVTILTISSFTIERYIAICHPFRQQAMSKLSRAVKFIVGIWIAAFGAALPQACQFGVYKIDNFTLCTIKNPTISYAFEVSSFIFFVAPMILICVLYILIGIKLKESSRVIAKFSHRARPAAAARSSNSSNNNNYINHVHQHKEAHSDVSYGQIASHQGGSPSSSTVAPAATAPKNSQRRIIKMLIAVVVAFFLCWAPFHAQRLLAVYGATVNQTPKNHTFYVVYTILTYVSGVSFFLSTCINPLLYSILSYKFRHAFKTTIGSSCLKYNWKKRWSSRTTGGGGSWKTTTTSHRPHITTADNAPLQQVAVPPNPADFELRNANVP